MGRLDKIPLGPEKKLEFKGHFDMKETYSSLKSVLGKDRLYDVTEKNVNETEEDNVKKIVARVESDQYFNDYYKIVIRFIIEMNGKDEEVIINNKKRYLTKGEAKLAINGWIEPDYLKKRNQGVLGSLFGKIYEIITNTSDLEKCKQNGHKDIESLSLTFRQHMNSKL